VQLRSGDARAGDRFALIPAAKYISNSKIVEAGEANEETLLGVQSASGRPLLEGTDEWVSCRSSAKIRQSD
jgi:hypothetical protein